MPITMLAGLPGLPLTLVVSSTLSWTSFSGKFLIRVVPYGGLTLPYDAQHFWRWVDYTSIRFYGEEYELSLRLRIAGKGGIIPRLFVLTSARRLKRIGVVNQYWNWIVDYFSVLFWYKPISEELEDWPTKAWQTVVASFSWQRVKVSL